MAIKCSPLKDDDPLSVEAIEDAIAAYIEGCMLATNVVRICLVTEGEHILGEGVLTTDIDHITFHDVSGDPIVAIDVYVNDMFIARLEGPESNLPLMPNGGDINFMKGSVMEDALRIYRERKSCGG